jgi:hypothetical protein
MANASYHREKCNVRERIFMSRGNLRDWRAICEEVLQEQRPERVEALLHELLQALDRRVNDRREQTHHSSSGPLNLEGDLRGNLKKESKRVTPGE